MNPKTGFYQINNEYMINSVIAFLYQFGELTNYLTKNKNIDFLTFKNIIVSKLGANIKNVKTINKFLKLY